MSDTTAKSRIPVISGRAAGLLVAFALLSFAAVIALTAFSDGLRSTDAAAQNPYSTAATGYGGFVDLLERTGETVRLSRIERTIEDRDQGVIVLTLLPYGTGDLDADSIMGPALVVLPKWYGLADRSKPIWQSDTGHLNPEFAANALDPFASDATLRRDKHPGGIAAPFGSYKTKAYDALQTLESDELETVVEVGGRALVAKMPFNEVYILSDPDFMNTFGMTDKEGARFAYDLIQYIKYYGDEPVIFDVTLHGFVRSQNLVKIALTPPFLGGTLVFFATLGLLAWNAATRFGAALPEDRAIALGKAALADNTAGLMSMARRETQLAPGYLNLTRRRAAKAVGAPKTLSETELAALFDRLNDDENSAQRWSDLATPMKRPAASLNDLVNKAQAIYRWRKETTHERD